MIAFDTLRAAETRTADLERFATRADLAALQAAISELKAASTWRIVPAIGAFAAVAKLAP